MIKLDRPALINDGIVSLKNLDSEAIISFYEQKISRLDLIKFVPASGAATRMFKFLHEFLNNFDSQEDSINGYINVNKAQELFTFLLEWRNYHFIKQ